MSRGVGRVLLAAYPPSFRARYGDELAALLEDTGTGPRVAHDLLLGALRAWLRPSFGPDPVERVRLRRTATVQTLWVDLCVVLVGTAGTLRLLEDPPAPGLDLTTPGWRAAHDAATAGLLAALALTLVGGVPLGLRVLASGRAARRTMAGPVLALLAVVLPVLPLHAWSGSLTAAQRNGRDGAFVAAVLAWSLLVAGTALWWTLAVPKALRDAAPPAEALRVPVALGVPLALVLLVPAGLLVAAAVATGSPWGTAYAVAGWACVLTVVGAALAGTLSAARGALAAVPR